MDPKLLKSVQLLCSMLIVTMVIVWAQWIIRRIGQMWQSREAWFRRFVTAWHITGWILVVACVIALGVHLKKQGLTNQLLVRSIQGQTKAMNANLQAIGGRMQAIEARQKNAKAGMQAVFKEEMEKVKETVEKEAGASWQDILKSKAK